MVRRASNLEEEIRIDSRTFFGDLSALRHESITTCFIKEACVPLGLTVISALLSLSSCFVLMYQRCKTSRRNSEEHIGLPFYCFLGNLCSTVGAVLSKQLAIQVIMGAFMAAVDVVNFCSVILPMCLCWRSKTERRLRMMRRRRWQHLLAVCMLMVGGGYLTCRASHSPAGGLPAGRRLLHVLHGNTEILGYILGLLSFFIACTAKIPTLSRARRGEMVTKAHVSCGVVCSLAGALYTSAILYHDTQPEFILRTMPWLLSAVSCTTLDFLILMLHCCRWGAGQQTEPWSPDKESLLEDSATLAMISQTTKRHSKQQKKQGKDMTETGGYMDVNVQPARRVCLKEVTVSSESHPLERTVRVVRVDGPCSSDSSCSFSESSDLEWDFEEATAQWSDTQAKRNRDEEFPLQKWLTNHQTTGTCTCGTSGHTVIPGSGKELRGDV